MTSTADRLIARVLLSLRYLWVVAAWLVTTVGYWIRPYDMLADRRRWRWQPAQRCGGCWVCADARPATGEERTDG